MNTSHRMIIVAASALLLAWLLLPLQKKVTEPLQNTTSPRSPAESQLFANKHASGTLFEQMKSLPSVEKEYRKTEQQFSQTRALPEFNDFPAELQMQTMEAFRSARAYVFEKDISEEEIEQRIAHYIQLADNEDPEALFVLQQHTAMCDLIKRFKLSRPEGLPNAFPTLKTCTLTDDTYRFFESIERLALSGTKQAMLVYWESLKTASSHALIDARKHPFEWAKKRDFAMYLETTFIRQGNSEKAFELAREFHQLNDRPTIFFEEDLEHAVALYEIADELGHADAAVEANTLSLTNEIDRERVDYIKKRYSLNELALRR